MSADDLIYAPIRSDYRIEDDKIICDCGTGWDLTLLKQMAEYHMTGKCSNRPKDCPIAIYYRKNFP